MTSGQLNASPLTTGPPGPPIQPSRKGRQRTETAPESPKNRPFTAILRKGDAAYYSGAPEASHTATKMRRYLLQRLKTGPETKVTVRRIKCVATYYKQRRYLLQRASLLTTLLALFSYETGTLYPYLDRGGGKGSVAGLGSAPALSPLSRAEGAPLPMEEDRKGPRDPGRTKTREKGFPKRKRPVKIPNVV